MRNDVWDSTGDVTEVSGRLEIDGVEVSASDLSVSRSIPSNLPEQVAGVGGYTAATSSATLLPSAVVSDKSPSPWGRQTPQPLADVKASAVSGNSKVPVFSGVVDKVSGAADKAEVSINMVDNTDRLNRAVSIPPLARIMPPPTTDGSTNPMNIGLVSSYFVDRVLRACEYYATPPMAERTVVSVPLVGSTFPERGTIINSRRGGTWKEQPYFASGWDAIMGNRLYAAYEPLLGGTTEGNLSRPMEINLTAGDTQDDGCRIFAEFENGAKIAVAVTSGRSLVVQFQLAGSEDWVTYASGTQEQLGQGWKRASVRIQATGDRRGTITIRTNTLRTVTRTGASLPWGSEHLTMTRVVIDLRGNDVGGVQVAFPASRSMYELFKPNAYIGNPPSIVSLQWSPVIQNEPALSLLTKWAEQECAAFWVDEEGKAQWRSRVHFTAGNPVADLTSTDNILNLSWSHDIQGAAARVIVKYKHGAVQRTNRSRVPVWQGSGQVLEPGDELEEIVAPPDDEIWIKVDGTPQVFQAETAKSAFNKGLGSWIGYVAYDKDGDIHGNTEWVGYEGRVRPIGGSAYQVTNSWTGHVPDGVTEIKLATQDAGTALKSQYQNFNLPILRAQLKVTLTDVDYTATAGGPKNAPDLTHEAGWWVQDEDMAKALAFWLAQQTAKPLPVVEGLEIISDPRLQLGDKVNVHDTHRTGLRITGVITEIQHNVAAGDHGMTIRLLVTDVLADKPTLFEYDSVFSGATLSTRDEVWSASTLAQFDTNPLRR